MKIPHGPGVARALRNARTATTKALTGLNRVAGQRMAKGDYSSAEALAAKGREIAQFDQQLKDLLATWRTLSGRRATGGRSSAGEVTPLWGYYQSILKAIVEAGGECHRDAIEAAFEGSAGGFLQPGDRVPMSGGRTRWKVMIRRARKHLRSEGWIDDEVSTIWRITPAGRKAAELDKPARQTAG